MWPVFWLGLIQGLSEFLPISSSGHLILFKSWFGLSTPGAALEVALHGGTLVAVLISYRAWILSWIGQLLGGQEGAWRQLGLLAWASLPAGIVGYLLGHVVEHFFFLQAAALGWASTALLLWYTPPPREGRRTMKDLGLVQALVIGLAQSLALWPGLSRSGTTIAMARVLGLAPEEAAQFSFLMTIPAVMGAGLFEWSSLQVAELSWPFITLGMLVAAVTGLIAIKWVRGIVNRPRAWRGFAVYTAGLAVLVWVLGR